MCVCIHTYICVYVYVYLPIVINLYLFYISVINFFYFTNRSYNTTNEIDSVIEDEFNLESDIFQVNNTKFSCLINIQGVW